MQNQNQGTIEMLADDDFKDATWIQGGPEESAGVCITKQNIVVKVGPHIVNNHEEETLRFVRATCPNIPVPEVLGKWTKIAGNGNDRGYLALSLMPGKLLKDAWADMTVDEQRTTLEDYSTILKEMRSAPVPENARIGAVDGIGRAADVRGSGIEYGGPFAAETEFHAWQLSLIAVEIEQFHGSLWSDTMSGSLARHAAHKLKFTHGDLGMHNVLVQHGRITAVIDWEFAGWYPEYWEFLKLIQFSRIPQFKSWAQTCWTDENGTMVRYDEMLIIDQVLDGLMRHGERVIKRPR